MPKQTIEHTDVADKRVLVRVDFNVPLRDGAITDDRRIRAALPTIKSIVDRGGRAILMSHLGRPSGEGFETSASLAPVATRLGELLGTEVRFPSHDCTDADAAQAVSGLENGQVLLLENLRFNKGEKKGDPAFSATLANYGEIYVNDAFGTCHRTDASMFGVPECMTGKPRVVGFLVEKEIRFLSETIAQPEHPFTVILGGAKVSDKLPAIENLLPKADDIIVGGAMAYTFLKALGRDVGSSRVEDEMINDAKRIIDLASNNSCELHLPEDHISANSFSEKPSDIEVFEDTIKSGYMGLDIGPKTTARYAMIISKAKTIVWNGPMGVFEWLPFKVGTQQVAKAIADATSNGATSIVGGGDSAAAVEVFDLADKMSHVSTGGGASLEMLEGKAFKALEVLDDA
ncbi:MAG: phosphoglycerate kinase [Planctomycetota bacterium]